jgi:hypothetical protein
MGPKEGGISQWLRLALSKELNSVSLFWTKNRNRFSFWKVLFSSLEDGQSPQTQWFRILMLSDPIMQLHPIPCYILSVGYLTQLAIPTAHMTDGLEWISQKALVAWSHCHHDVCLEGLKDKNKTKTNSMALVRERTIPTQRPPLVGQVNANFCG